MGPHWLGCVARKSIMARWGLTESILNPSALQRLAWCSADAMGHIGPRTMIHKGRGSCVGGSKAVFSRLATADAVDLVGAWGCL